MTVWKHEINSTNAAAIDATAHRKWIELTHTAATVTVTFSASTPAGKEGGVIKNTSAQRVDMVFASGATQVLPQHASNAELIELLATHDFRWRCLDNIGGTSARYLIELLPQRHTRTGAAPTTLAAQHSTGLFRVTGNGTTTIPSGGTLRRGFGCTFVNPLGSGFAWTLDGPGAIDVQILAGETATVDVLDNQQIVISKGPHSVVS